MAITLLRIRTNTYIPELQMYIQCTYTMMSYISLLECAVTLAINVKHVNTHSLVNINYNYNAPIILINTSV